MLMDVIEVSDVWYVLVQLIYVLHKVPPRWFPHEYTSLRTTHDPNENTCCSTPPHLGRTKTSHLKTRALIYRSNLLSKINLLIKLINTGQGMPVSVVGPAWNWFRRPTEAWWDEKSSFGMFPKHAPSLHGTWGARVVARVHVPLELEGKTSPSAVPRQPQQCRGSAMQSTECDLPRSFRPVDEKVSYVRCSQPR